MIILGVDPGLDGALVWFHSGTKLLDVIDVPTVAVKVADHEQRRIDRRALANTLRERDADLACIEEVHSTPQMGVVSAFTFGGTYGALAQAIVSRGVSLREVSPMRWKRDLGIPVGADKTASRQKAQHLFPVQAKLFGRVKDDGRAEAALIAWWMWLQRKLPGA